MYNSRKNYNFYKYFKANFVIFTICVSILMYQSINLMIELSSGKTVINISVEIIRNTTLPAITFCPYNLDFYKLSLLNENISEMYKEYLEMIENSNTRTISENNLNKPYNEAVELYFNSKEENIEMEEILNIITPSINNWNETILSSIFNQASAFGDIEKDLNKYEGEFYTNYIMKSLPMESFRLHVNEIFPFILQCYTLFSHFESSWNNINMVFDEFSVNLKLDYNSIPITRSLYIVFLMHSPNTMPFEAYSLVNPGNHYIIDFSKWNIERLGKGYDTDCREYDPKVYTRNDCLFDCYQERGKHHCLTNNFISSNILKKKTYFEQSNLNFSKCKINIKIKHEILESCYGKCNQECHITYYSFTINKFRQIYIDQAYFLFKHNAMPDLTIRHIPEMSLLTFICNFGGILGMWLGVSFVSILNCIWNFSRVKILSKISMKNIININKNKIINNIYANKIHNHVLINSKNNQKNLSQTRIVTS